MLVFMFIWLQILMFSVKYLHGWWRLLQAERPFSFGILQDWRVPTGEWIKFHKYISQLLSFFSFLPFSMLSCSMWNSWFHFTLRTFRRRAICFISLCSSPSCSAPAPAPALHSIIPSNMLDIWLLQLWGWEGLSLVHHRPAVHLAVNEF